jgi:hypothetical protein
VLLNWTACTSGLYPTEAGDAGLTDHLKAHVNTSKTAALLQNNKNSKICTQTCTFIYGDSMAGTERVHVFPLSLVQPKNHAGRFLKTMPENSKSLFFLIKVACSLIDSPGKSVLHRLLM